MFARFLFVAYLALLALAIPWYWPAGDRTVLWPGLPAWALAAYLGSAAVSLLTAFVLPRLFAGAERDDEEDDRVD